MDSILLIGIVILVFIGIPVGLGLLFYSIPKKLGYPKTAKYLTIGYGILVLIFGLYAAFEDQLFTKNNARGLVEEYDIELVDDFILLENKSMSSIGDYYHTFTLEISEKDKQNAISKIKSSDNFKRDDSSLDKMLNLSYKRYSGHKVIQNYETENAYVRGYLQPTFKRILISKTKNELIFEHIDE